MTLKTQKNPIPTPPIQKNQEKTIISKKIPPKKPNFPKVHLKSLKNPNFQVNDLKSHSSLMDCDSTKFSEFWIQSDLEIDFKKDFWNFRRHRIDFSEKHRQNNSESIQIMFAYQVKAT